MRSKDRRFESGPSLKLVFFLFAILVVMFFAAWKMVFNYGPRVKLMGSVKAIGAATHVAFQISDPSHSIKRVRLSIEQNGKRYNTPFAAVKGPFRKHPAWEFWRSSGALWRIHAEVGGVHIPKLTSGKATLRLVAVNNSWNRFFRGGRSALTLTLPVRLTPPQVFVMTSPNDVTEGGCGLVVFRVSPGTVRSGVQVGDYFFRSWRLPSGKSGVRFSIYAYPYGVSSATPARIVARDDAGNQTIVNFNNQVLPRAFHKGEIMVTHDFMERVVPPIMSETPQLKNQGSLLANFLEINRDLRATDTAILFNLGQKSGHRMLWSKAFLALPESKVEATFGDARSFIHHGEVVDHEVHLGYDLASVAHAPVPAANNGKVIFAAYLGIFGNAIVIDHGCGVETLYGHLDNFDVKVGETVKRGQIIGHTDSTGLAVGDHLHFGVLLDGIQVDPIEWWDPHWIRDQITDKLAVGK